MTGQDDLADSLTGLAGLLSGAGDLGATLVRVAHLAVQAIPDADGAGLTLLEPDRPQTVVATGGFVEAVDDIQYRLAEGPCVSAVAEARTYTSGNLGGSTRWPRFGPRAGRLGVHSALSLPLLRPDGTALGALNVYAHRRDCFDEAAIGIGEAFAGPAAVSVANAGLLAVSERLVTQLNDALSSRAVIDQAIGILMSRTGATAQQAFEQLGVRSRQRSVRLADIARDVVEEAVGRARARHADEAGPDPV